MDIGTFREHCIKIWSFYCLKLVEGAQLRCSCVGVRSEISLSKWNIYLSIHVFHLWDQAVSVSNVL